MPVANHQTKTSLKPRRNSTNKMGGMRLLCSLPDECARIIHLDPQYRHVLNHLGLGNEGENRERRRKSLPAMDAHTISCFVEQSVRILRPSGYLFLWADKFIVGEGAHRNFFNLIHGLGWRFKTVDFIAWDKLRIGMGKRSRCCTEYLIVGQKAPFNARDTWRDHSIPDSWQEKPRRDRHPHEKPIGLLRRLFAATTAPGDLIVDPCAGSYVALEVCRETGREFLGCDLVEWGVKGRLR